MRLSQISGLTMVAAMTFLAGCSGGGNSATGITPTTGGGAQSHAQSQALGARPVLKVSGATRMAKGCPSEYTEGCYQISASSPASFEWCFSSTGNCSSGLVGEPEWTVEVANSKGKEVKLGKKIDAVWSPDPGNPSTLTISTDSKKTSPKIKYGVFLTATVSSQVYSDFASYGIAD